MGGQVKILNPQFGGIKLGFNSVGFISSKENKLIWENTGICIFNTSANIGVGSCICCNGKIEFGKNFSISARSTIIAEKEICFGENCLLSWDCLLMDTDYHPIYSIKDEKNRINPDKEIYIGDNVWISCRSTILKGSKIPRDCIVAAGSLICKEYQISNAVISSRGIIRENITRGKR